MSDIKKNKQKDKEIAKTIERMNFLIEHVLACIDEVDSYKCMFVTEREKLIKLTGWKMLFNENW